MKSPGSRFLVVFAGFLLPGCVTEQRHSYAPAGVEPVDLTAVCRVRALSAEVKNRILALNPEQVGEFEVRDLLSPNPAPHIISIHGGIFPIKSGMNSFAQFLIGMGYPEACIRDPGSGSYCYGYYDQSERIAGEVAWFYERDGLRPIIVGHSQGGIQALRVLHKLGGDGTTKLAVWNPISRSEENRYEITDPLTGRIRPVVGLQVSYATAALAGGLARVLPNQWDMNPRLRDVPDSVEEFTGFQKGLDLLGGDFLGYGPANDYRAVGSASVRNVRLPSASSHSTIPYTKGLLKDKRIREWIQAYHPGKTGERLSECRPLPVRKNAQVLWAAEVWYGIKKHWVLELQRLIWAQRDDHEL